jgi:hypothetical protein
MTNKIPEATSVHDMELENGTTEGICPFTVHTLTSEEYDTMNSETLKAIAAKHLDYSSCNWTFQRTTIYLKKSKIVPSDVSMAFPIWIGWYWS